MHPVHRAIAIRTAAVTTTTQVTSSSLDFGCIVLVQNGRISALHPSREASSDSLHVDGIDLRFFSLERICVTRGELAGAQKVMRMQGHSKRVLLR